MKNPVLRDSSFVRNQRCDVVRDNGVKLYIIAYSTVLPYIHKKSRSNERLHIYQWFKDYLPSSIFLFNSANASMSPRVDLSSLLEEEVTFLEEASFTFFFSSSLKIPV